MINQDIVAWVGQGAIADRTQEMLRSSDVGISMMRQRFFAEMEAVAAGRDPLGVIRDPNAAKCVAMPNIYRELNTDGVTLAEFQELSTAERAARERIPVSFWPAARCTPSLRAGHGSGGKSLRNSF